MCNNCTCYLGRIDQVCNFQILFFKRVLNYIHSYPIWKNFKMKCSLLVTNLQDLSLLSDEKLRAVCPCCIPQPAVPSPCQDKITVCPLSVTSALLEDWPGARLPKSSPGLSLEVNKIVSDQISQPATFFAVVVSKCRNNVRAPSHSPLTRR